MADNTGIVEKEIGLIGMGLVGSALIGRFQNGGFTIFGCDTSPERCREASECGVYVQPSPAAVANKCSRVVLSLPDSKVVRQVVCGDGGLLQGESSRPGASLKILDTTTGDPAATVEIAGKITNAGSCYVDACLIGSSKQIADGDAVVVAGGSEEDFVSFKDLFKTFARDVFHMGPAGKGSEAKLVVNLVLGLNRLVLAEGLLLAEALALDGNRILEVLKSGAAYSKVMDTKGAKMLRGDFEPQARLAQHLKDVELILALAKRAGAALPASKLHRELLTSGVDMGLGQLDNSAILEILRRLSQA